MGGEVKDELNGIISESERREIDALYERSKSGPHSCNEPLLCRWNHHKWSKWWTFTEGEIRSVGGEFHIADYVEQKRFCLRCYKCVLRREETKH
jgi:hypothetical protein